MLCYHHNALYLYTHTHIILRVAHIAQCSVPFSVVLCIVEQYQRECTIAYSCDTFKTYIHIYILFTATYVAQQYRKQNIRENTLLNFNAVAFNIYRQADMPQYYVIYKLPILFNFGSGS